MQLWVVGTLDGAVKPPMLLELFEAERLATAIAKEQRDSKLTRQESISQKPTPGLRRPVRPERARRSYSAARASRRV